MDYKNIQELIKTVSDSQITSFEIEYEGNKIKIEKRNQQVLVEKPVNITSLEPVIETSTLVNVGETIENTAKTIWEDNVYIVKSPMVGTMYAAPSTESRNFVKVGSKVKIGDTLCILEAMKLMNEIESEVNGEIVEVLVLNEHMVEYGQPLFRMIKD